MNEQTNIDASGIEMAFEIAMLDFEQREVDLIDAGKRLRLSNAKKRLVSAGRWTAQWMIDEYALVACNMSRRPRIIRELIGAIGDMAMDIDAGSLAAAQSRVAAIKNTPPAEGQEE